MMFQLCALKRVGWAVVLLGAERLSTGGGGGGGYVSRSVKPTLCSGYFLNQTSLLPVLTFPELLNLYFFCLEKGLIVILVHFEKPRRNTQFLKQTEPESLRMVARRAFP